MYLKESAWNREGLEIDICSDTEVKQYLTNALAAGYHVADNGKDFIVVASHDMSRLISTFTMATV